MSIAIFSLDEKLAAIEMEISEARKFRRDPSSPMQRHFMILKAIAADLRARQELPRSNALGSIERELQRVKSTVTPDGFYDPERCRQLANIIIGKWPVIAQSLEAFGEESCE